MQKRYLYALLFGVPGLVIALVGAILSFAVATGVAWLYLFGDAPWPAVADTYLSLMLALVFLLLWSGAIVWGFRVGKRLESVPGLNPRHALLSAGITAAVLLLIGLQQLSVGNLGRPSDSLICGDFCRERGFVASGLTPRNAVTRICSCYDSDGQVVLSIELERIAAGRAD